VIEELKHLLDLKNAKRERFEVMVQQLKRTLDSIHSVNEFVGQYQEIKVKEIFHKDDVNYLSFSPDGKMLATGSEENTVKVTDLTTGATVITIQHEDSVSYLKFSPDGR